MEYEKFILSLLTSLAIKKDNKGYYTISDEVEDVYRKARAFDEISNVDYIVAPDDYAHEVTKIVDKYMEGK